ncbi:MAG: hypothetical protein A3G87_00525 [Omnitrophica bacterium RIFCSPLOWO2_12_FULL_50_11]|nr:MAG: hypothetical protein A3G87_00525 [Omnitrophica bacterium RIFCSPLOWO2_12_FULL_50_11]
MNLEFAILSFASLFVIVDPIGLIPAFLAMTPQNTVNERIKMAALACAVSFMILLTCVLTGQMIFDVFSVTLPAFEIAGGIVLLLIGLDMLQAKRTQVKETKEEQEEGIDKSDIAITPLAIPMLAGPGAITTAILLNAQAVGISQKLILITNVFMVCAVTFGILALTAIRSQTISVILLKIITRLMGLVLTAIAVQFILNGVVQTMGLPPR